MSGEIKRNGKVVCKLYGSYLGFLECDGRRYWDARDTEFFPFIKPETVLTSDSRHRTDLCALSAGNIEEAQARKEEIEDAQRRDVKIREEFLKKRK